MDLFFQKSETVTEKKAIHAIRSTGVPGVVQIRSVDCCCLACIWFTGHCEVKHADHWTTDSLKEGEKLTKKTHWSQFEDIVPESQKLVMYPLMENTKLQKDRNTIKVQGFVDRRG